MSLVLQLWDNFVARIETFRGMRQPTGNRVITFRNTQNSLEKRAIPLFGSDTGFGQDWASSPRRNFLGGPIPKYEKENLDGVIREDATPLVPAQRSELDVGSRVLNYGHETDQKPLPKGKSPVAAWDGVVRNTPPKADFQAVRGKCEPTVGDLHALDLKKWPFDFSV